MASILSWMFTKPHTVVSFPNVALCEVKTTGHEANGELDVSTMPIKKFMFRSSGAKPVFVAKDFCV